LTWDVTQVSLQSTLADIAASAASNGFTSDFGTNVVGAGFLDVTFLNFASFVAGPTFNFFSLDFIAIPPPSTSVLNIGIGAGGDWQDVNFNAVTGVIYEGATINVGAVPVPPAVWLFGSGLIGLVGIARRRSPQLA
jgi:hypothetical protein